MLDSDTAIIVVCFILAFLLIAVPVLEAIPKIRDGISRRYILASIYAVLGVACVIDFKELNNDVRYAVIIGSICIIALTIVLFTTEKIAFSKLFGLKKIKASWNEKLLEAEFQDKKEEEKQGEKHD